MDYLNIYRKQASVIQFYYHFCALTSLFMNVYTLWHGDPEKYIFLYSEIYYFNYIIITIFT
jgi:hypothetical protein